MNIARQISHIRSRRAVLRQGIDVAAHFEAWEESCVPSYCHPNRLAAYVSWARLFRAVALAESCRPGPARVLDFGSSVGELGHLIHPRVAAYEFVEQDEGPARYLKSQLPAATRQTLESAPDLGYDWVFAVDALEHNEDYPELIGHLAGKLAPSGILVLSGPTENFLYRLGRRIAGFEGHYHVTTIYDIERAIGRHLRKLASSTILPLFPLFRISAWSRPERPPR